MVRWLVSVCRARKHRVASETSSFTSEALDAFFPSGPPVFPKGRFEAESVFCQEGRNNKYIFSIAGSFGRTGAKPTCLAIFGPYFRTEAFGRPCFKLVYTASTN